MKKSRVLILVLVIAIALVLLPFVAAPLVHNYKIYCFDASIKKIPVPQSYEKVAQKKWFGLLWACGNHADYLVVAVFRGKEYDAFVYEYFNQDFSVYCPEDNSDAKPFILKQSGGKWYSVGEEKSIEESEASMADSATFNPYVKSLKMESREPLYFIAYCAQGKADFDLRTF
ncbi:MAG: hypothetical protein J6P28_01795 [Treponema sp.]|nr:hypothetical protein [Treponema sp.]